MTPLAHFIVKDLILPKKRRRGVDEFSQDFAKKLSGAHCFELTAVWPIIENLAMKIAYGGTEIGPLGFLPAEKTWIEFDRGASRFADSCGFLIESNADGRCATYIEASKCSDYTDVQLQRLSAGKVLNDSEVKIGYCAGGLDQVLSLFCGEGTSPGWSKINNQSFEGDYTKEDIEACTNWDPAVIFASLALINSPRMIGRRQHMPHRGLERRLVAARGIVGKFPLHAWTEIKLEVNTPRDMRGDPSVEAHYTGERALHFCRAHLRVRLGRLEIVRSHWRGDGSLGIKQSRYKLIPPRQSGAAA